MRAVGQEYVHQKLSTKNPIEAITEINRYASLQDPRCKPLLGLLDQLGAPRSDHSPRKMLCSLTQLDIISC